MCAFVINLKHLQQFYQDFIAACGRFISQRSFCCKKLDWLNFQINCRLQWILNLEIAGLKTNRYEMFETEPPTVSQTKQNWMNLFHVHLLHKYYLRWRYCIQYTGYILAPPKRGSYWEIHPLCPRYFPRPSMTSLGSREISWAPGMDFPITPLFWWSMDTIFMGYVYVSLGFHNKSINILIIFETHNIFKVYER